ncbi:ATP-grasp domain-containing protein [Methyloterricola oryzae]|uniref:ATP-grasp domain-containing protein n=1 Tax=Methyloterricola oryzae TaxID=1495050 RepID=UPI0005EBCE2E|nr:ATP-grasp domain-containing protein [Methyloterricola oryzae]
MKVLVYEYITGGGLRGERLPASLLREGGLMLESVVGDLLDLDGISVTVLRDDRLAPMPERAGLTLRGVASATELPLIWRAEVAATDATLPIAPESGGILEALCTDVERAGKPLLTTPADGVRLAASKLQTARRLSHHGAPVVPTERWPSASPTWPCVIKPDDGVGCEGTRIFDQGDGAPALNEETAWVVQPLVPGEALSLSGLFCNGAARLLSCNRQMIERAGNAFVLRGCLVNARSDTDGSWQALLDDIAQAVPELWGYAGVDLVLGADGPQVLEINPRLTTSYAGLRDALGLNPARLLLDLKTTGVLPGPVRGRETIEIAWRTEFAE